MDRTKELIKEASMKAADVVSEYTEKPKTITLEENLRHWRAERPDEWIMDRFIEKAAKLRAERDTLQATVESLIDIIRECEETFGCDCPYCGRDFGKEFDSHKDGCKIGDILKKNQEDECPHKEQVAYDTAYCLRDGCFCDSESEDDDDEYCDHCGHRLIYGHCRMCSYTQEQEKEPGDE